jgi:addiction module HigA family antidote
MPIPPIPKNRPPTHPGEILKHDFRLPLDMTQGQMAKALGIGRDNYVRIENGHRNISPLMALRLSKVLGTTVDVWMNMQMAVDLWKAERNHPEIKKLKPFKYD